MKMKEFFIINASALYYESFSIISNFYDKFRYTVTAEPKQ